MQREDRLPIVLRLTQREVGVIQRALMDKENGARNRPWVQGGGQLTKRERQYANFIRQLRRKIKEQRHA
jgi:hypothetical protein